MVNSIAQMRDRKAEAQRGEGSFQGLLTGLALCDLSLAGIWPHSLATHKGREVEALAVSRKMASGLLMRSGESFPSGGNCDNFPGPERPKNPLLHSPYLGSTPSSCLGSSPSSLAFSKPSHHLCFLSLETPSLSGGFCPKARSLLMVGGKRMWDSDLTPLCLSFLPLYSGDNSSSLFLRGWCDV